MVLATYIFHVLPKQRMPYCLNDEQSISGQLDVRTYIEHWLRVEELV